LVFRLFGSSVIRLPVRLWRVRGLMVRGLEVRELGGLDFRFFGFSEIKYRISNIEHCLWRVRGLMVRGLEVW
jgi:hypothetical protein